jgi:pimeloyl-ACP methyl ester carboxylesterase
MPNVIAINDRSIGMHEYGEKSGRPIFYCHGYPGSKLDGELLDFERHARDTNVRIIAIDRPGIGLSGYLPQRNLLDWSSDVESVANKLSITDFSVVGFSGGAPYALACAFAMPHRVRSVSVVGGMGPFEYKESRRDNAMLIPRQWEFIRRIIGTTLARQSRKNADKFAKNQIRLLPKVDSQYLSIEGKREKLAELFRDHFRQGPHGFIMETNIYREAWGFALRDIKPSVQLWHGTVDRNVSVQTARRIVREIPDCNGHIIEEEGHFSLIGKYLKDILQGLR